MTMPLIKTSELTGQALDWAVAKAIGLLDRWGVCAPVGFRPSITWTQGGPIIDREKTEFDFDDETEIYSAYDGV